MFNALEIKLDIFHCLKKSETKQNKPQRKNQQSNKQQREGGEAMKKKKKSNYTHSEYTYKMRNTTQKRNTIKIRKIHHLSYLAENIKETPGSMGIGKTEHSFEV